MKTLELEIALMKYLYAKNNILVVPNVYTHTKFETDMISISRSGYATGFEIKVSASDLKNDLKKRHIAKLGTMITTYKDIKKHALDYYYGNLKYFYYVVPENLREKTLNQIPKFAGLIVANVHDNNISLSEIREPTILFKRKWNDKMKFDLAKVGTLRILGFKEKLLRKEKC